MRRQTAAFTAAAAVGAGAAVLLLGRKVSEQAVRPGALPAPGGPPPVLKVVQLAAGRITLTRTPEALRPGRYALEWGEDGHAVVGEVVGQDARTVTRRLERADTGTLTPGTQLRLTPRVLRGDPTSALALPFTETTAAGELGPLPAWLTPGVRGTWVVLVHGPGADREQALPVLPTLSSLRLPTLTVTYRGDAGAPASPDGMGHFGETEWRDVESAVRLALDSGAGRVVLYGWSLGATIALQTAARSDWRDRIAGLVLDSPVLDWSETVRRGAVLAGAPAELAGLGVLAAEGRTGVDLAGFARLASGADLEVPVLLLQSPEDAVAPALAATALAERRPELVSLHSVPGAAHAALWNADPDGYAEALRRFLTPLL
ncbi:alpha/beta hydrolase [Kitasatospora sp. MMS16-BH015]|uniref:alpha/beta hydrolase family protein n=1 Tax=Kitasatospora sp. MMS16-BH015 TaxID=2018025 RepID=UPI000CA0E386|nr:alpha/beta hydrolase [Kitasatospora sp. MMS16-BH015]AUG80263.1 alpha/beta hydrolase [Kitasatospora sp. MMS16-BH015]